MSVNATVLPDGCAIVIEKVPPHDKTHALRIVSEIYIYIFRKESFKHQELLRILLGGVVVVLWGGVSRRAACWLAVDYTDTQEKRILICILDESEEDTDFGLMTQWLNDWLTK